jgi:hypothetical protein
MTGQTITIKKKGATTRMAVATMLQVIDHWQHDPMVVALAQELNTGPDKYQRVFNFCFNNIYYEPNPDNHQRIRTPARTLADRQGSCVDYSVLIASLLLAMNEPVVVRLVSQDGATFGHVYCVTTTGVVLDPVLGQDQSGNEYATRAPGAVGSYNLECEYLLKNDHILTPKKMELTVLNGTATINAATNVVNYATNTINGCPCQAINGAWIPMQINGTTMDPKPMDATDAEYQNYVMAVLLDDPDATATNGFKAWRAKQKEKRAGKKDSKAGNREKRQVNRSKRREKFGQLVDTGIEILKSKGKAMDAETKRMLEDIDEAGINPSDNMLVDLLGAGEGGTPPGAGGGGGEKDNTMLYVGGAALAAFLLLNK